MANDTVRLIVHAVCFLTIFIGAVGLVVSGKVEPGDALQWLVTGAGLLASGLGVYKLSQDRRTPPQ